MKILIFIEHSSTVRHFLDSNVFSLLAKKHEVSYVIPFGHKRLGNLKANDSRFGSSKVINLPAFKSREYLWNMRFSVELLRPQKGWTKEEKIQKRKIFKSLNPLKTYILFRFLGTFGIFQIFTFLINRKLSLMQNTLLNSLLKKEKPDVIIHPTVLKGVYINDLVDAGNKFKIPVVMIMNSWDNPCSKRSVVNNNYLLLVWGPQSRRHAERFMNMDAKNIIEFGAAQFDIYKFCPRVSREEILLAHGLDPTKTTLLYAGTSKETDEFLHLCKIDEAIDKGTCPKLNIIYRPHPWGAGGKNPIRFINHSFSNISIDNSMKNYLLNIEKGEKTFYSADYQDTRDILSAVDAVISPLSTILVEAMLMGKPPLCFMPIDEENAYHFNLAYQNPHFKELLEMKEMQVVWGNSNLIDGINELTRKINSIDIEDNLKKASQFYIKKYDLPFCERIVEFVENL